VAAIALVAWLVLQARAQVAIPSDYTGFMLCVDADGDSADCELAMWGGGPWHFDQDGEVRVILHRYESGSVVETQWGILKIDALEPRPPCRGCPIPTVDPGGNR
jgi:hypothetical protein